MLRTLALERLRYEDLKFKDSMNFTVRPYQKKNKKQNVKNTYMLCAYKQISEKK